MLAWTALLSGALAPTEAEAAKQPLVYVVVIDALDGDKVEEGKAPFISSLLAGDGARATYYPASRAVMPALTNPNHVAMMSGAFSGQSGNPANTFAVYAPLEDEESCARTGPLDYTAFPTETSGENQNCPQAQFVFEAIERQGAGERLTTAAIFGKPKLGRIFAGRNVDPMQRDVDHLWAPCTDRPDDDEYCGDVQTNPITGYAIDDATVMDEVVRTIEQGVGAGDERPDLTFVNLQQVDQAGHATGTGVVYDQAIAMADDQVERLVSTLRARGLWERSVLILLSDHSMDTTPQKVSLSEAFSDAGIPDSAYLAVNTLDNGSAGLIYLADRESPDRFELLKRMRETALATPGVAEALYREPNPADGNLRHTIEAAHPDWNAAGVRSGDLFVTSERGIAFGEPTAASNPLPGHHGGPQTRDNFLAVVSGGELVENGTQTGSGRRASPQNTDIASTVMGMFGLFRAEDDRGRFLVRAFDRRMLKRVARPPAPRVSVRTPKKVGGRYQVSWRPKGGTYDLEIRSDGNWKRLRRRTERTSVTIRPGGGQPATVRVRAHSAAKIPSAWTYTTLG
jgi:hypothetical protein